MLAGRDDSRCPLPLPLPLELVFPSLRLLSTGVRTLQVAVCSCYSALRNIAGDWGDSTTQGAIKKPATS